MADEFTPEQRVIVQYGNLIGVGALEQILNTLRLHGRVAVFVSEKYESTPTVAGALFR